MIFNERNLGKLEKRWTQPLVAPIEKEHYGKRKQQSEKGSQKT
jgi:hypothetical protein